ncbi:MAG: hypothetical protein AB7F65_00790 [Dehalococcoidia bacterium]
MRVRQRLPLALLVPAVLLGAACSEDTDEEPTATGTMTTATATATGTGTVAAGVVEEAPEGAAEVSVVLREWAIEPAESSVPAGEVYFLAQNEGPDDAHELVIIRSDAPVDELPTDDRGFVPEDQVEFIGEIEAFAPGSSASGVFTLESGRYILICNIVEREDGEWESHYLEGMRVEFTVE